MSHHFCSKKLWFILIGFVLLAGVFLGSTLMWLERVEKYVLETKLPVQEEKIGERLEKVIEKNYIEQEVQMAAQQSEKPVGKMEQKIEFPCVIRIVDGTIGVYQEKKGCLKTLKQVGEQLTDEDELKLRNGIYIADEKELIMVLESYHLQ